MKTFLSDKTVRDETLFEQLNKATNSVNERKKKLQSVRRTDRVNEITSSDVSQNNNKTEKSKKENPIVNEIREMKSEIVAASEWQFCGSAGQGHHLRVAVPICRSRVDACGSITNICRSLGDCLKCGSRDAGREMRVRVAGCESRDTNCDCQMSRDWGILWRTPMAYPWRTFVTPLS